MMNDILKYILTTCIGAILSAIFAFIKIQKNKVKYEIQESKTSDAVVKEGIKILLRADLKSQLKSYIAKGKMTTDEYDELQEELKVYEHLDGDGTVHKLWELLQEQVEIY